MVALIPAAIAAAASAYAVHRQGRNEHRARRAERHGNSGIYGGRGGLRDQIRAQEQLMRKQYQLGEKYGMPRQYQSERLRQIPTLNKSQQKLLDKITRQGGKEFGNFNNALQQFQNQLGQQASPLNYPQLQQNPTFAAGQNYLQNLFNPSSQAYQAFAQPMINEFNDVVTPGLKQSFSNLGALSSSGFTGALAHERGRLQDRLNALRTGLQQQALPEAFRYGVAPSEQFFQGETARQGQQGQNLQRAQLGLGALGTIGDIGIRRQHYGLGTQPFMNLHRPAQFHALQGGNPNVNFQQQQPQQGFLGQLGSNFASGLGTGLGQFGANALGNINWGGGGASPNYSNIASAQAQNSIGNAARSMAMGA